MTWQDWLSIAEFIVVTLILVYEMKSVAIEQESHKLYRDYFESRKAWYEARGKKRSEAGGGGDSVSTGVGDAGNDTLAPPGTDAPH